MAGLALLSTHKAQQHLSAKKALGALFSSWNDLSTHREADDVEARQVGPEGQREQLCDHVDGVGCLKSHSHEEAPGSTDALPDEGHKGDGPVQPGGEHHLWASSKGKEVLHVAPFLPASTAATDTLLLLADQEQS